MKRKKMDLFPVFLASLLFIFAVFFYFESVKWRDYSKELENENAALNNTLAFTRELLANETALSASLGSELESTRQVLDETNSSLRQCHYDLAIEKEQLNVCLSRNEELNAFLVETSSELENLSTELGGFQEQIEESMSWFTENSNMANFSPSLRYQIDKCTSNTEINAPCIPIVMKEEKGWTYRLEEEDRLLSLEEIVNNRGGDCEDWSLYFKAAYNYLKGQDRPERYIISAVPGTGDFRIYSDHYYADAEGREAGTTNDYVYIICYDSHCVVAVSNQEIKNSTDVHKLEGAIAIEPQNGQYVFTVGNILAPNVCTADDCSYSDIWLIITDDDIYDFHYNWRWVSYRDFYEGTVRYKNRVDAMEKLLKKLSPAKFI
jgi:hypothetical protein